MSATDRPDIEAVSLSDSDVHVTTVRAHDPSIAGMVGVSSRRPVVAGLKVKEGIPAG